MGNLSVTPAIPAADGTGAGSPVATFGLEKTISVDGTFTGSVTIEIAGVNGFVPIAAFTAPGRKTLKFAADQVRVVRKASTAIPGTPAVTVSANDDGSQSLDVPLGAPGASIDTKSFGTVNTIIVDGTIDGVVKIQTSEDDAVWTDLCGFQTPGHKTLEIVARFIRVDHVNNVLASTPSVSIGAINDDTAHRPVSVLTLFDTPDGASSDVFTLELTANHDGMSNPVNVEPGQVLEIAVQQDVIGGRNINAYGTAFFWIGGTPPNFSAQGANAENKIRCLVLEVNAAGTATKMLCDQFLGYAPFGS